MILINLSKFLSTYFDSINPKLPPDQLPNELTPQYAVSFSFKNALTSDPPVARSIRLPVIILPLQNLEIVSASVPTFPCTRAADYSSTSLWDRTLWIKLIDPPQDPRDRCFARVLGNVPDPLSSNLEQTVPATDNPPLHIKPETVHTIMPKKNQRPRRPRSHIGRLSVGLAPSPPSPGWTRRRLSSSASSRTSCAPDTTAPTSQTCSVPPEDDSAPPSRSPVSNTCRRHSHSPSFAPTPASWLPRPPSMAYSATCKSCSAPRRNKPTA
jgi:hypothetical protein